MIELVNEVYKQRDAVDPSHVRFAVATGGSLGGRRMIAHVQLANVRFFEHLGWRAEGDPGEFHGVEHQLMSIGLVPGAQVRERLDG